MPNRRSEPVPRSGVPSLLVRVAAIAMLSLMTPALSLRATMAFAQDAPSPFAALAQAGDPGEQQVTLASGNVLEWQEPWRTQYDVEPNDVSLVTPDGAMFVVSLYPVAEHSPETAATINARSQATVVSSVADQDGVFSYLQWFTNSSGPIVEYTRAWTSSDGQWTMSAYLRSELTTFHRDLTLVTGTISLDGAPLWEEVDAEAVAAAVQESSGMEVPTGGPTAGEFTSVNGTVFGYPGDWTPDTEQQPDGVQLLAGEATLVVGDLAEDQDPAALFNQLASTLPQIVDQGAAPDGGYYGLAYGQDNAGRDYYMLFRFLYAEGTGTPVIVVLAAPATTFADSLTLAHGITANGQPVLDGLDDAAVLATFDNGGPTGAPIFTGGQASQPAPTDAPAEPPVATGNEMTGPAGTLFSWSDAWSYQQLEGMPPSAVILLGIEVPATIMIFEGAAGQDVDTFWAEYSSTGGEVIDEGQSPDGGYYEVSYNEASASPVGSTTPSYTLTRAYATETAPVLVSVIINGEEFTPSLTAARDVTVNGVSILDGVDDAALVATFENGGPAEAAIFTGGEAPAPGSEPGNDPGGEGVASPRDIVANVPIGLPEDSTERGQAQEEGAPATYTSEMFGHTLAWGESWVPYEDAPNINEADGYEIFALQADGTGTGAFSLFSAAWDTDLEARDYIEYWSSDEFVQENFPEGTEVVLVDSRGNSGAVVYLGPQEEGDPELWVTIYEVVNVDDEIRLEPTLVAPLSDFEDVYDDAVQSITLDGDEVLGYFSTKEIVDELP